MASVPWNEAAQFCKTLSAEHGIHCRLPTEAEWEYACRAGTLTQYSFGDAWSEAASRQPNPWGLCDMHGNLWEWCSDWYDPDYYITCPSADPSGPRVGHHRVLRGGSWGGAPDGRRSAFRGGALPAGSDSGLGFRVLCSARALR